jgi:hypothetical protein
MYSHYRETVHHIAVLQKPAGNGEMRVCVDCIEQCDKTIPFVNDKEEHWAKTSASKTTCLKTNLRRAAFIPPTL